MLSPHAWLDSLDRADAVLGLDRTVPLLDGRQVRYVNLDNAASTPPLRSVVTAIEDFLPYYSSVHRGTGFKSRLSSVAYDQAHEIVARFVGADPATNTVIFGKNTTEAINKLSYRLPLGPEAVVLTTLMEHHSNDLPWRDRARVVRVGATPEGRLDEADFDRQLARYGERIALVAVSGASNVTGFVQPVHRLARKAHAVGARILVDAAQLAPHRPVSMKADDDPEHLDFVVLSAHKLYAPFGTGALIGPRAVFSQGVPEYRGGGTVDLVTQDEVFWAGAPDRDEAGSPNVVGAVALAAALRSLARWGLAEIAAHEAELTRYALSVLSQVPGLTLYGETDPARVDERAGVIPFNLDGLSHFLVAAILGYEGGIGVRSGCFCAQPYVVHLLGLAPDAAERARERILRGDRSEMPGMVRISFGCYTTREDIDRLGEMLHRISRGDYAGRYQLDVATGEYRPQGYQDALAPYFALE